MGNLGKWAQLAGVTGLHDERCSEPEQRSRAKHRAIAIRAVRAIAVKAHSFPPLRRLNPPTLYEQTCFHPLCVCCCIYVYVSACMHLSVESRGGSLQVNSSVCLLPPIYFAWTNDDSPSLAILACLHAPSLSSQIYLNELG
uniref:Uncharacterized protein n=1 Tax=Setaria digitata TaxID=48799 RepID=A0A915PHG4_9BILA